MRTYESFEGFHRVGLFDGDPLVVGQKSFDHSLGHGDQQSVLVFEVPVDTRAGDAGGSSDVVDPGPMEAFGAEEGDRRVKNHFAAVRFGGGHRGLSVGTGRLGHGRDLGRLLGVRLPAILLVVTLFASLFLGAVPAPAVAVGETWPNSNESDGCGGLQTPTPLATRIGSLPSSERLLGPYGDMFGRTIGAAANDLVTWTVPMSGGRTVRVHRRALPAFQQVAVNLAASGKYYAIGGYTYAHSARTVGGSYGISRHAFGIAIDINANTNPYQAGPFEEGDTFKTDMPAWFVKAWTDAGFCWGGDWLGSKDPMHFSWQGPGFTAGYGNPATSYTVATAATDFTNKVFDESTFFAGRTGVHLIGDVSGDGAPDPIRAFDKNGNIVIQYVSTRSEYAECGGVSGAIPQASIATDEVIVGDFAGYRRSEVGVVDESGAVVSIELLSQRGQAGDIIRIDTAVPVRPDQTYVVGDYNWDNAPDLYVIVNQGGSTDVEVWDGASGFNSKITQFIGLYGDTAGWHFSVGDRDLDELPDLYAFEPRAGGAVVHIFTNTGKHLTATSTIDATVGALTVADFDGDGRDDIWRNVAGGSFAAWMGGNGTPRTSWFRNPQWECPDEWDPLDYEGTFLDDDTSGFQVSIEWMFAEGLTFGCNPPLNDRYCPDRSVTRGEMAAFLARVLDLPPAESAGFTDTAGSIFVSAIDRIAAAGITRGCDDIAVRFCPDDPITRDEMAAFLVRAKGYTVAADDPFIDDDGSIFESAIERLAFAGVTRGCNPPTNDRYCPRATLTRGQMAAFLYRAFR